MTKNINEIIKQAKVDHASIIQPPREVLKGDPPYPRFTKKLAEGVYLKSNVTRFDDGQDVGFCTVLNTRELTDEQFEDHALANIMVAIRPIIKQTPSSRAANELHMQEYKVIQRQGRVSRKVDVAKTLDELANSMTLDEFIVKMGSGDKLDKEQITNLYNALTS